jgi:hypothetical protein
MRDELVDIVRMTKDLFEVVKITGNATTTLVQAKTADAGRMLNATLHTPQPLFEGEFGLLDLGVLDKCFANPVYQAPDARFDVRRGSRKIAGVVTDTVTALTFHDASAKGYAIYKTMAADLIERQATVSPLPWEVTIQPEPSKIAEFKEHAKTFADVDNRFRVTLDAGDLLFSIGADTSATHCVRMVFARDVGGILPNQSSRPLTFEVAPFLSLLRVAGAQPVCLTFSSLGVLGVSVQTSKAGYQYYQKAKT